MATHSIEVPGARAYAVRLDQALPEIKRIRLLNVRNSHIKPGARAPRVRIAKFAVIVHYYNEGQMQRLMVVPAAGVALAELQLVVSDWIAANPPQ